MSVGVTPIYQPQSAYGGPAGAEPLKGPPAFLVDSSPFRTPPKPPQMRSERFFSVRQGQPHRGIPQPRRGEDMPRKGVDADCSDPASPSGGMGGLSPMPPEDQTRLFARCGAAPHGVPTCGAGGLPLPGFGRAARIEAPQPGGWRKPGGAFLGSRGLWPWGKRPSAAPWRCIRPLPDHRKAGGSRKRGASPDAQGRPRPGSAAGGLPRRV